jgi:hypothetical protein
MKIIQDILDWSEVWAPLITLAIFFFLNPKAKWVKPIFYYLILAIIFGAAQDIIWKRKTLDIDWFFKEYLWWWYDLDPKSGKPVFKNLIFYTLISFSRLFLFAWFFNFFLPSFKKISRYILWTVLALMFINFTFLESIKDFSSSMLSLEAGLLLFYCLKYFYKINMDDEIKSPISLPHYWVVMGLTLYSSVNFMIFLFYKYLTTAYKEYSEEIWNIHNISYIVLCTFIVISFFRSKRK